MVVEGFDRIALIAHPRGHRMYQRALVERAARGNGAMVVELGHAAQREAAAIDQQAGIAAALAVVEFAFTDQGHHGVAQLHAAQVLDIRIAVDADAGALRDQGAVVFQAAVALQVQLPLQFQPPVIVQLAVILQQQACGLADAQGAGVAQLAVVAHRQGASADVQGAFIACVADHAGFHVTVPGDVAAGRRQVLVATVLAAFAAGRQAATATAAATVATATAATTTTGCRSSAAGQGHATQQPGAHAARLAVTVAAVIALQVVGRALAVDVVGGVGGRGKGTAQGKCDKDGQRPTGRNSG